ncbi:MAG: DUF6144 family protein [Candidatus Hodarchaeales archaeon]
MSLSKFKDFLTEHKVKNPQIELAIKLMLEFEEFLKSRGKGMEKTNYEDIQHFSLLLLQKKKNSFENYIALLRYGYFTKNNNIIIAIMEVIDGSEVISNMSKRLTEEFGVEVRNKVFGELDVPPLGLSPSLKPEITKKLVENLIEELGKSKCQAFLANGLRDKYIESYKAPRERYLKSKSIDEFLQVQKEEFIRNLTKHMEEESLFFTQEISPEVIEYIRSQKGMTEAGIREGDKVYMTKMPYDTKKYLSETDPKKKKYHYCHCPWVREALLKEERPVDPIWCNCSGGYYKNFWEAVLAQPVTIELLESVIQGDEVCKFALHLPSIILPSQN